MPKAIPVLSPSYPQKERGNRDAVCEENCDPLNPSGITSYIGSHLGVHKPFIINRTSTLAYLVREIQVRLYKIT